MPGPTVVEHPLVARHLTVLRDTATPSSVFRQRLSDVSMLLLYEALRDLTTREVEVDTPLETTTGRRVVGDIVVVAILRAGLGMTDGALRLLPEARVGHLGMYRDEESLQPVGYYESIPSGAADAEVVVVVDPMLATGGSAINAIDRLKAAGATRLRYVCLVAAPEGVAALAAAHPDVPIHCASVDRQLDERGYIRPGLGDAGDRIFGTD
jgi:uracil phosphoribosyltransferase